MKIFVVKLIKNKIGQATYITPLNHLPLLPSGPGGFGGSWLYKTCPLQIYINYILIYYFILKNKG